jgi:hypothetical protein
MHHYNDYLAAFERMPAEQRKAQFQRPEIAREQLRELELRVPRLTLTPPSTVPAEAEVFLDSALVRDSALGTALPVDPGLHEITLSAPGIQAVSQRVTIETGEQKSLQLQFGAKRVVRHPPRRDNSFRGWKYVALGTSAAGILVGSVAGVLALREKATVSKNCDGDACNAQGSAASDRAQTYGIVSTSGFLVGAAGIGVGALLWSRESKEAAAQSSAGARRAARLERPLKVRVTAAPRAGGAFAEVRGDW